MRIRAINLSEMAIADAIDRVNDMPNYIGNAAMRADVRVSTVTGGQTEVMFRLRVLDSHGGGASVTGIHMARERHSINACWHLHRDVMAAVLLDFRDAEIRTGMVVNGVTVVYKGAADFLTKYPESGYANIGSQMHPVSASEACDCHTFNVSSSIVDRLRDSIFTR